MSSNIDRFEPECLIEKSDALSGASHDEIQGVEKILGITLPGDYAEYLAYYRGPLILSRKASCVPEEKIPASAGYERVHLSIMYGLADSTCHLLSAFASHADALGKQFLPIGEDGADNILLLGLDGLGFGHVYLWVLDQGVIDVSPKMDKSIYLVASSFGKFMSALDFDTDDNDLGFDQRNAGFFKT